MSLLYNRIFVDVSQFVAEPLRTGVQRVLTQVTRYLPRERIMPFKVLGPERVGILDPTLFDLMIEYFETDTATIRSRVAREQGGEFLPETVEEARVRLVGNRPIAILPANKFFRRAQAVLNLENFADPMRSRFYIACRENFRYKVYHLVHDFLLYEHPELFPQLDWRRASDYVKLFEAFAVAGGYIVSNPPLAAKVARYFARNPADVHVSAFGADIGPAQARGHRVGGQRRVVVLGTIEPRKFPEATIAALDQIAAESDGAVECIVVGRWGWVAPEARTRIAELFRRGRVQHLENLSDAAVAELMANTNVAVSLSVAEGFGLPVIEFAAHGIPVVTNDGVPAASLLDPRLLVRVARMDRESIVAAIRDGLARGVSPAHRYTRSWADCAADIVRVLDEQVVSVSPTAATAGVRGGWEATARLAKILEQAPREWEETKIAVRERLAVLIAEGSIVTTDQSGQPATGVPRMLIEEVSEVVSDNRGLRYWSEIEAARPLVVQMLRCVLSDNYIECLRRAYLTFLGRSIDPRAAAEAPTYAPLSRAIGRVREVAFSPEAEAFLGAERALALRKVISDIGGLLEVVAAEHFDLFRVFAALEIGEPTLADVFEATALLTEKINPLEITLYFGRRRRLRSDMNSVLLDILAEVFDKRGLRIRSVYAARDLAQDDDTQGFIRRAYRLILRKEVDDEGLQYYHRAISEGRLSRQAVLEILAGAEEARSRGIAIV